MSGDIGMVGHHPRLLASHRGILPPEAGSESATAHTQNVSVHCKNHYQMK
jgi:hypothetical protein